MARQPISAYIITFNEEDQIGPCLDSLSFCEELIVVDSLSTDKTAEIARARGARVIEHRWEGHVLQKTFALAQTTHPWTLSLDADERVSPELRESIERALSAEVPDSVDGFEVNRVVFYLGQWWRRGGWYPEWRLRLARRGRAHWTGTNPHDKLVCAGEVRQLSGELEHFPYDDMDQQFFRLHQYSTIAADEEFRSGNRISAWSLFSSPLMRVFKFYVLKGGYREGFPGLVVSVIEGYYSFMKYAKLWERQRKGAQAEVNHRDSQPRGPA